MEPPRSFEVLDGFALPDGSPDAEMPSMRMEEGLHQAVSQIDAVLADLRSFAADLPTAVQIRAWMLGPDGWTMPVGEVATELGDSYRYEWTSGEDSVGFEGELLESLPPVRAVTIERMARVSGEGARNELTLTPVAGSTLLSLLIIYPDLEMRDAVLATGMVEGMETSYVRLEVEVLEVLATL